jgi:hypothetical protein
MAIDLLVIFASGLMIGAALIKHDVRELIMWVILLIYAVTNYAEHRLKGSKYDY